MLRLAAPCRDRTSVTAGLDVPTAVGEARSEGSQVPGR